MPGFQRVRIQRFKNIDDTTFDLRNINVIVGANNSGKSTLLQALHFAMGSLQSLQLNNSLRRDGASTASSSQLIYIPSDDAISLGSGGTLLTSRDQSINITLTLATGETVGV